MLASQCFGSKSLPALVMLHGFLGSHEDWLSLVPELENRVHLVMIDLPGHGCSPFIPGLDFIKFADVLEQTVSELELKQFSLLGYSLGGRLAMSYGSQFPDRLDNLILEGSHPGLLNQDEQQVRLASDQRWADRFISEPVTHVLSDWYQQPVFADLTDSQRQNLIEVRSSQKGADLGEAMMAFSLGRQPDFRSSLRDAEFPVHYLYGERDSKFGALGCHMNEIGCLTSLQCVAGSGHNVHREKPVAFSRCILPLIGADHGH